MTMWMVRSGREGRWSEDFTSGDFVGLGWHQAGNSIPLLSKAAIFEAVQSAYPTWTEGQAASGASQLWRFKTELAVGDDVITYDSGSRLYHVGKIGSEARYEPGEVEGLTVRRDVHWQAAVSRDDLSLDSRNRLGSTLSLFKVPDETARELLALATGDQPSRETHVEIDEEAQDPFEGVLDESYLRIADRISALDWQDMQNLVAALLRAMGYRTEVSPLGPDRGKDIIASPDGFGFEQPRIVVEVKHRTGEKIDAPAIRSFLGGRHASDRGLYVSTGGFSREAYYEAERSNIPLKLLTLEDLARAVVEHYDRFGSRGKALLPLDRIYWPA